MSFQINVTIRRGMGSDINASCGQLRQSYIKRQKASEINGLS